MLQGKLPAEVSSEVLARSLEQPGQAVMHKLPSQALWVAEQPHSAGREASGSPEHALWPPLACLAQLSPLLHCSSWDTAPCSPASPQASVARVPEQSWVIVSQHSICLYKCPAASKVKDANLKAEHFRDAVDSKDICVGNVRDAPMAFVCCLLLISSLRRLWLGSREEDASGFALPW